MSGITDMDISHGYALQPDTLYRKLDLSLNGADGDGASWLWLSKQVPTDEIAEIRLIHGTEACPEGWE